MHKAVKVFNLLGILVAHDKLVGPFQCITYLGIEINAATSIVRLPPQKFVELHSLIVSWLQRSKCKKRHLLSLIGKLSFAAKVVKPGRLFLRRLIDYNRV